MRRLIISVAVYLVIADILVLKPATASPRVTSVTPDSHPVTVGGFFDDILQGIEDLNNTIRGVRSTINEVNRLQDDLKGKNTQTPPNNQTNTINPTTEEEQKSLPEQQQPHDDSQLSNPEQLPAQVK